AGTPCEEVVLREISRYPANVTEVFPHHTKLQELGAESYFGVAIFDQQEKVVGILGIIDTSPLKPEEVENQSLILNIFAARAGIELERKKTQTQLSKQADQLRQHNSVLTSLAKNQALHQGNLKEAFQDITEVIANTLKVEQVSVWLLNQEKTQLERQNMYQRSNNTHTQLYAAIELETAPTYQKTLDAQEVIALENPASLNVAIQLQGEKVGLLSVQEASISSRVWELEEEMFIRSTADLISLALQAQERNETQITLTRQIRRIVLLEQITQQIRQSLNPKIIFQTTVDQLGANFAASRCHLVSYVSKLAPIAPILAEYCAPAYEPLLGTTIPVKDDYFIQAVLSADKAVSLIEIEEEKELTAQTNFWREIALQSVLAVRSSYQGKANGMIILHQCDYARKWTEAEIELLESVAIQVGIAIAQSQLLEKEKKQREELSSKNHALIQATEEAEIANRAKSEFLAKMSHELRTPLNAILGFSQLMSRDSNTTPQQKETLDIINRSGEHLLQLINGVLDMSKIEAGKIELNCEDFNLHRCLTSLRDMFSLKAESKGIELKFQLDNQLPRYFTTDQSKLRQILINLLSNAIKFTHSGYVALRVLVSSKQLVTDDVNTEELINLHFEIEDTGVGIAPEEIDSLFDLFVQTESGRKSEEGTGLGLPISRKFVQMMGGDLKVTSQVAQGSQFTFNIQGYVPKHIFTTDIGEKRVIGLADAVRSTNYRILIVDDRPESRLLMTKLLSSIGFVTNQASNGLEAIEIYQSWQPHLIFMDMHMPIMNGYEATPEIRLKAKMAEDNSLKIIACTASAFEENRARVLDVGCDDFLRKPYKENMLFEKIAEHLNVEYIYESVEVQAASKEKGYITVSDEQIKAEIEQLPIDWLEKMHQAAICLDLAQSNQLIAEIRPNHTFLAERFQHYLDFLQFEQLIKYTSKT
ncbi:MAG: response regulator, partial [Cyanobacteria bacterium J083]